MTFGDKTAGILDDQAQAVAKWAGLLAEIMEDSTRLECGLADMKLECLRLERAGMYDGVPTESWEGRNGSEARYLRLVFPVGARRGLADRKLYVGCKPEAIAEARRKMANRIRWEKLEGEICDLERVLRGVEAVLNRQRLWVSRRPLPDLGTAAAPPGERTVPKMEGKG